MRQTHHDTAIHVGEHIQLNLMCSATIVGRTFEEEPTIDLHTPWGTLNGIPRSVLGTMAIPVKLVPDDAETVRPAHSAAGQSASILQLTPKS